MSKPPSDLTPAQLVAKLVELPFTSEVVAFPRPGVPEVRLRVLESIEQAQAELEATKAVARMFGDIKPEMLGVLGVGDCKGSKFAAEIVARACYLRDPIEGSDPPQYRRMFASGAEVEASLTTGEIAHIMSEWLIVQSRMAGDESTMKSQSDVSAWVERLREGLRSYPFLPTDSRTRGELACILSERLQSVRALLTESTPEQLPTQLAALFNDWDSATPCSFGPLAGSDRSASVDAVLTGISR